jgi:hypothetical protein
MAAVIGEHEIFVRRESLITIFHQKWLSALAYPPSAEVLHSDVYRNIGEGIKSHVLRLFGATTYAALSAKQETFIEDMKETILFHEVGHGVIQHEAVPTEIGTFGEATKVLGENSVTALLEVLADVAPRIGKVKGPFQNIVEVSKTDVERATRMFFMYFSDTYFFDTEDEYMYLYSDLMALIFTRYICPGFVVDFQTMADDLAFRANRAGEPSMLEWLIDELARQVQKLKSKLPTPEKVPSEGSYSDQAAFWTDFLDGQIKSQAKKSELNTTLEECKNELLHTFFASLCGSETAKRYENPRRFIADRCGELGLVYAR